MDNTIVFDIETVLDEALFSANVDAFAKPKPTPSTFDPLAVRVGNLKDRAKIAAKRKEAETAHNRQQEHALADWHQAGLEHLTKRRDKAALFPALSRICAIGWQAPSAEPRAVMVGRDVEDEKALLLEFFSDVYDHLVDVREGTALVQFGYWSGNSSHHQQFDLNHLAWAASRNGLILPEGFAKYAVDVAAPFFRYGPLTPKMEGFPAYLGLNSAVALTGGHGQVCDEFVDADGSMVNWLVADKDALDVEGASFGEWLAAGEHEKCETYLLNDLACTRWLVDQNIA